MVKADPVILTKEYLADHKAQGIILDSGNANACAPKGMENAKRMPPPRPAATGLAPQDFAVCSTGIIGSGAEHHCHRGRGPRPGGGSG